MDIGCIHLQNNLHGNHCLFDSTPSLINKVFKGNASKCHVAAWHSKFYVLLSCSALKCFSSFYFKIIHSHFCIYLHILGSLQMYRCYFSIFWWKTFLSPKKFNVCDADKSTDVYLIIEWWVGHYSKISETVKYRDRMLFLLAYSHYPYKCICVKK